MIVNDGIHKGVAQRDTREDRMSQFRHGEKMIFGKRRIRGRPDGLRLKVVTISEDGYTLDDVLTTMLESILPCTRCWLDGYER